jgi:hypothetical protein
MQRSTIRGSWQFLPSAKAIITITTNFSMNGVKPWQIDPTKGIIWILSKVGLATRLCRVPTEKNVLAEVTEAQRRLEATLANPGLTEATATYIETAYHSLREAAQQRTQRKAGQLEVTREMLDSLRNQIRVATNALRLAS